MKITFRIYTYFIFCLLSNGLLISQNGLEKIIVEKYYISNANDTLANAIGGYLPIGSVTYRIFVDMLPGYQFQLAYGNKNHEMFIKTDTKFFNNAYIGNTIPNIIPNRTLKQNTVMLDSWLSVGAAGENLYGVLKEDDDTLETVVHEKSFLQNSHPASGIPINKRDGLVRADEIPRPTFYKIDSLVTIFNSLSNGLSFSTKNGAWACLAGASGLDSLGSNRLLIAQITTDGTFSFELNIQVGKRNSKPENYVAKNPIGNEILLPSLIYQNKEQKIISSNSKQKTKKNK